MPWMVGLAMASPFADLEDARDEIAPWLEQELGREFRRLPGVSVVRRDVLAVMLAEEAPVDDPDLAGRHPMMLTSAPAVYFPDKQAIYVVVETVEDLGPVAGVRPQELPGVLRCSIAHEMTHALQVQYAPWMEQDTLGVQLPLLEGQAEMVADRYCRQFQPDVAALFETLTPRPALGEASLASTVYATGHQVMTRVYDVYGWEGTWAALYTLPSSDVLLELGSLPPVWTRPDLLSRPIQPSLPPDAQPVEMVARVSDLRLLLDGLWEGDAIGHLLQLEEPGRSLIAVVFQGDGVHRLIDQRVAGLALPQPLFFGQPAFVPKQKRLRGMARRQGLASSLRLEAGTYAEWWAATDDVLLAAMSTGLDLDRRTFEGWFEELGPELSQPPEPVGPESQAWIASLQERPAGRSLSPWYRLQLAEGARRTYDPGACSTHARQAMDEAPDWLRPQVAALFQPCVVASGDLETAEWLSQQATPGP